MRSLHVIDSLNIGGTQLLAQRTMLGSKQRGIEVGLAVLTDHGQVKLSGALPEQVRQFRVHGDYRRPGSIAAWGRLLQPMIAEFQPDIIHSWLWLSDVVAGSAAVRARVPHVAHLVDRRTWLESNAWKHRYRRWLTRRILKQARTSYLAVSHAVAEHATQYLELPAERITVAWNSVEVSRFDQIPAAAPFAGSDRPLVLGIAARIEPEKGHQFSIDAIAQLRDSKVACELRITGDGSLKPELIAEVKRLGLEDRVKFVGWVADVAQFLSEIDVFLVPSVDSEGLPTTILEAMGAARVVIATDVGGAREAIRDGREGLLVKPADSQSLANAIQTINSNRSMAGEMAQRARQRVAEAFSSDAMMDTVLNKYSEILGTKVGN